MGNWFSWLFGSSSVPTPVGFRRIWELPVSSPKKDFTFLILDWRPPPHPPHEIGSLFIWLEIDGRREQFFLSRAEALHFEAGPSAHANHLRVVKNRGRFLALPVNPKTEKRLSFLPPPPATFPPANGPKDPSTG